MLDKLHLFSAAYKAPRWVRIDKGFGLVVVVLWWLALSQNTQHLSKFQFQRLYVLRTYRNKQRFE